MAIFDEKVKRKNIFWFFIMLSIFIAILSRSRGHLVLLSFITLIFYNYRVKRINFLNLLKIFIIILIMVFLIAQFRGSKDFRITKKNISNAFGGLFTEFQATATLLSQYERRRLEHYNGQIFFQDVALSLIPRKIWPEKPKLYGGVFVTDILIPNRQPGFYYTVGTFGGSFADFGYIGVILMMFFAGFFMRIGYDYMMKNIENDFILLIYAIFCFYLWAFIRGGLGSIPVLVEKLFPIILIYLLITEKRKKGNFI